MESNKPGTRHCHSWLANLILFQIPIPHCPDALPAELSKWRIFLSVSLTSILTWNAAAVTSMFLPHLVSVSFIRACHSSPKSGMNAPFTFILLFLPLKNIHILLLIKSWWPHYSLANTLFLKTLCFVLFLSDIYMSSRDLYWLFRLTS